MKKRVVLPHYKCGQFESLQEAVRFLKNERYSWDYHLVNIISYNLRYRDCLRDQGIDALLHVLVSDAPELAEEKEVLAYIRAWYDKEGKNISDYDIQCYNINDVVNVLGHEFQGLSDVMACSRLGCSLQGEPCVYAYELYQNYPVFDSFDLCDKRTYQNYFFSDKPFDAEDRSRMLANKLGINYCMVHEEIPDHLLPVLYYRGDGNYMLLATRK